ncbi:uncharacterized protein PHACADRAFT_255297 [Phanerochaete carnosa HHB-10118-sp]|uniref:Uncharacterized protein n=1 Tax=Phanerochaete carnosa (strain HHB-10118-sp) TaxID=650164 RepID=K5UY20_PHACS|nr:uncharacterized protein PHACADRAFT_255297 [Phanerochaete carnosa HHB-10118-sp]EKM55006.1 hypothetical protein PHACADRAFT_255297 [Phanerochaete carnosa HHB-10118-sp]
MGGFVLDSSSTPVFGTETQLVLSPAMMAVMMKHAPDIIPDISEDHIRRQSKSNALAKALLVLQLIYFSASCVARLVQELPLSLLEVWTLAHALGAILVYVVWWKKPFDIPEATLIMGERARELAAYFQVIGQPMIPVVAGVYPLSGYVESAYLTITPCELSEDSGNASEREQETLTLLPGQSIHVEGYTFAINAKKLDPSNRRIFGTTHCPWHARRRGPDGSVSLSRTDILRWRLAARAATRIGGVWWHEDAICYTKAGGLEASEGIPASRIHPSLCAFVALMTTYALPHFLGWNAVFPTLVERTMWRVASIVVGAFPITIYGIYALIPSDPSTFPGSIAGFLLLAAFIAVYIVSNVFLLIESLRQLPDLPDGAFLLPNFSVYFPHFA